MNDNPDFQVGNKFQYAGLHYRILPGNRCPGDRVIEFSTDGGKTWHRPAIAHGIIMYEFKCAVEAHNYPHPSYRGHYKLMNAYAGAIARGWRSVAIEIEGERRILAETTK